MERICNPVKPNFLKGNMQLLVWNFPLKGIWKTPAWLSFDVIFRPVSCRIRRMTSSNVSPVDCGHFSATVARWYNVAKEQNSRNRFYFHFIKLLYTTSRYDNICGLWKSQSNRGLFSGRAGVLEGNVACDQGAPVRGALVQGAARLSGPAWPKMMLSPDMGQLHFHQ